MSDVFEFSVYEYEMPVAGMLTRPPAAPHYSESVRATILTSCAINNIIFTSLFAAELMPAQRRRRRACWTTPCPQITRQVGCI